MKKQRKIWVECIRSLTSISIDYYYFQKINNFSYVECKQCKDCHRGIQCRCNATTECVSQHRTKADVKPLRKRCAVWQYWTIIWTKSFSKPIQSVLSVSSGQKLFKFETDQNVALNFCRNIVIKSRVHKRTLRERSNRKPFIWNIIRLIGSHHLLLISGFLGCVLCFYNGKYYIHRQIDKIAIEQCIEYLIGHYSLLNSG